MILGELRTRFQIDALLAKPATRQFIRYVIAGFCVSQFAALIYSALTLFVHLEPLKANVVSTSCGVATGYLVHNYWSFAEGTARNDPSKLVRFLTSAFLAFVVNTAWVWLLVKVLRFPPLAPVPFMMFVTPWVSFFVNRHWVFKAA
ncbi:MAG: GtrA family protein [Sphingomicrobium sp.]